MDRQQPDVNPNVGEETSVTPPSSVEGQTPEKVETPVEGETETGQAPKKGAESRIRELNAKAKAEAQARAEAEGKVTSLSRKVEELTGQVGLGQQPYTPIQPGAEVTPEQYKADVARTADAVVNLRLQQKAVVDKINSEANDSMKAHPKLDPDAESFDKELSETVTEATLAFIRANPTASVKKFVDKLMKPYERSLEKTAGEVEETVAKQVSSQALRPTSGTKVEKKFAEKSLKEMEQELGVVY